MLISIIIPQKAFLEFVIRYLFKRIQIIHGIVKSTVCIGIPICRFLNGLKHFRELEVKLAIQVYQQLILTKPH